MRDKTPWHIYPPDEPKKHSGDDALGVLVGFLLVMIFVLVAIDHALFRVWMAVLAWWDVFVP